MNGETILVFDADPKSFQILQRAFINESVQILWANSIPLDELEQLSCSIILFAVQKVEDYEAAYDVFQHFESAVMFLLAEQHNYDAFEARNAGAVGAFFKPLHIMRIYERLIEIIPKKPDENPMGQLDGLYVPKDSFRRTKLVSFMPTSPVQDDLEAIVEDLLPLIVEQVLKIQLSTSTEIRNLIQEQIRQVLRETR